MANAPSQDLVFEYNILAKMFGIQDLHLDEKTDEDYLEAYLIQMVAKALLIFDEALFEKENADNILFLWDTLARVLFILPTDKKYANLDDTAYFACTILFFPQVAHTWEFEEEHFIYLDSVIKDSLKKIFEKKEMYEACISFSKKGIKLLYTGDSMFSELPESSEFTQFV